LTFPLFASQDTDDSPLKVIAACLD
jgi:hypothetical protein